MHNLTFGNSYEKCRALPARTRSLSGTQALQPVRTMSVKPEVDSPIVNDDSERASTIQTLFWYGVTDTGKVRERNEDNFAIFEFVNKTLFIVADGMGGHEGGEVASRIAVETACKLVQEEHVLRADNLDLVERAVQEANLRVREEGASRGSDMGTTLCVALVENDVAYVANVGDSRAYWIENGSLSQITTDHSLVAKLVAAGKLTKEEARNHPKSNLLFRTIGNDETVTVDTFRVPLKKGGTLLLCTDGLWGDVADEEIQWVCAQEQDSVAAGDWLVDIATENGGKDNITAVVVKVR